jgi:hypothetical protein
MSKKLRRTAPSKHHPKAIHDLYEKAELMQRSNYDIQALTGLSYQTVVSCVGGNGRIPRADNLDSVARALNMELRAMPIQESCEQPHLSTTSTSTFGAPEEHNDADRETASQVQPLQEDGLLGDSDGERSDRGVCETDAARATSCAQREGEEHPGNSGRTLEDKPQA